LVSRSLVQQIAQKNIYDISNFQKGASEAYVMSPKYTANAIADAVKQVEDFGVKGISLRYAGKYNIPDYDDDNVTDRQEASDLVEKAIHKSGKSVNVLTQTGNAYVAVNSTDIVNMPLYSRRYNNTVEIPFAALVYSGHTNYTSTPRNLSGSTKKDLLKLIESGAGLLYTVSNDRDDEIKKSEFDSLYAICYKDLKDSILSDYKYVNEALDGVYGTEIVSHEILKNNVVKVTYKDGTYFIINYNDYSVTVDNITVKAADYFKGGNS